MVSIVTGSRGLQPLCRFVTWDSHLSRSLPPTDDKASWSPDELMETLEEISFTIAIQLYGAYERGRTRWSPQLGAGCPYKG